MEVVQLRCLVHGTQRKLDWFPEGAGIVRGLYVPYDSPDASGRSGKSELFDLYGSSSLLQLAFDLVSFLFCDTFFDGCWS